VANRAIAKIFNKTSWTAVPKEIAEKVNVITKPEIDEYLGLGKHLIVPMPDEQEEK
jgi:hypothetical protein